jgi:hypothetical protein
MTDWYLKAADEDTMNAALEESGALAGGVSIDVIGQIVRTTGYDDNGDPITVTYPEWHVNLRGSVSNPEALEPFVIVPPEVPFRTWG